MGNHYYCKVKCSLCCSVRRQVCDSQLSFRVHKHRKKLVVYTSSDECSKQQTTAFGFRQGMFLKPTTTSNFKRGLLVGCLQLCTAVEEMLKKMACSSTTSSSLLKVVVVVLHVGIWHWRYQITAGVQTIKNKGYVVLFVGGSSVMNICVLHIMITKVFCIFIVGRR